jgi:hypothetical protein
LQTDSLNSHNTKWLLLKWQVSLWNEDSTISPASAASSSIKVVEIVIFSQIWVHHWKEQHRISHRQYFHFYHYPRTKKIWSHFPTPLALKIYKVPNLQLLFNPWNEANTHPTVTLPTNDGEPRHQRTRPRWREGNILPLWQEPAPQRSPSWWFTMMCGFVYDVAPSREVQTPQSQHRRVSGVVGKRSGVLRH